MTEPNSSNTLTLGLVPLDAAQYPAVLDQALMTALTASEGGGSGTQGYFDAQNQTSDFWLMLAGGQSTFSPGLDPEGRPVIMASSGNVEMRVQAVPTSGDDNVVGVLTISTFEVSSGVQRRMTTGVVVQDNPSTMKVDAEIFMQLLPVLYESTEQMLIKLAGDFAAASQVEAPVVDAETLTQQALFWVSKKVLGLSGSFAKWALEYSVVTWGEIALETTGVGVLIAIPVIVEFLGHSMRHSVLVQNLTDGPVSWSQWLNAGDDAVHQPGNPIAAVTRGPDPLAPESTLTLASGLNLQYLNSSEWGSIGYVLSLTLPDQAEARVLFSIPWAGDNVTWVGASADDPAKVWAEHVNVTPPVLAMSAEVGQYRVLVSMNALAGKTYGAYFYCSTIVIQPK